MYGRLKLRAIALVLYKLYGIKIAIEMPALGSALKGDWKKVGESLKTRTGGSVPVSNTESRKNRGKALPALG